MNKTKIIFWFCLALILFFNFALAGLPEKRNVASGFTPDEKATSGINPDATEPHPNPLLEKERETSGINPDATKTKTSTPAAFILVTDVIDGFGGQRYNGGCDLSIFAGGQSSAIGPSSSTNFKLYAGFVYPTVVTCGDVNGDGKVTVSDVVYLINFLFKGGPVPKPFEAGEANCDGKVSVSDVVYLINYLFKGGPPPIC